MDQEECPIVKNAGVW